MFLVSINTQHIVPPSLLPAVWDLWAGQWSQNACRLCTSRWSRQGELQCLHSKMFTASLVFSDVFLESLASAHDASVMTVMSVSTCSSCFCISDAIFLELFWMRVAGTKLLNYWRWVWTLMVLLEMETQSLEARSVAAAGSLQLPSISQFVMRLRLMPCNCIAGPATGPSGWHLWVDWEVWPAHWWGGWCAHQ